MFRKKPKAHLKEIEEWPTTLDGYGLFVNDKDQIRLICRPEEKMIYRLITRWNIMIGDLQHSDVKARPADFTYPYRAALTEGVLSNLAQERLEKLGMKKMNLPLGVVEEEEPHTVILVSADFETNTEKVAVLIPFADELGMWASRVMDEETVHAGSLEDACKTLLEKGYAVVALNPKQNYWDPVRKVQLSQTEMRYSRRKFKPVPHNHTSSSHIQYVMDNILSLSPAKGTYIFSHWGSCREILEYLNITYDEKWDGRLIALGMAQGTYPLENITSAKFRIFLAETAINYLFIANTGPNVLLTNTNIGCPNISVGPSCELYEYMATRTFEKIVQFFEGGQPAILVETVVDEEPEGDEELDGLGNWEDLKEKIQGADMEKLLEVGIGAGEDDSEWFRIK